ncbi:hypothetical protein IKE72_02350 [Candidatus Saccharibacteria bacterium]|nr:hypothetical protein [Candidatus Saccharibacteria bacterium]
MGTVLMSGPVTALSYQTEVQPQFTFSESIQVEITSTEKNLIIEDLVPGTNKTSNEIDVRVSTNSANGYTLTSTAGDGTTYKSTALVNSEDSNKTFTSLATSDEITDPANFGPGEWGFSYKQGSSDTWNDYSGLPSYLDPGKTIGETDAPSASGGDIYNFRIAAKASPIQASGTYNNVITFYAVSQNPAP